MPPPLRPLRICSFHPRPRGAAALPLRPSIVSIRGAAAKNNPDKLPEAPKGQPGPNTQQQEHISEEAAKMAKIQGNEGPDLSQGTPVQEIIREERKQQEQAPEVLQQEPNQKKPGPSGTRSFSTFARRRLELQSSPSPSDVDPAIISSLSMEEQPSLPSTTSSQPAFKFPPPPIESIVNKSERQDPLVLQLTNLLMRDGKKSVAQRNMSVILNTLRSMPAPTYSATRPLIPGAPPASYLPLNPISYLTLAVDSVAPLMRLRSQRGAAGGGAALQIPLSLGLRQRRRAAFTWIVDAASKRPNRGSGRDNFAVRVAQEIVAVVEGKSGAWEKRHAVHRLATSSRTNINYGTRGFRR